MKMHSVRARLMASSMICGVALAGPALAQTAAATNDEVAEVVVTGTRIPSPNLESVSPVTAVTAAEIKAAGVTRVEDMTASSRSLRARRNPSSPKFAWSMGRVISIRPCRASSRRFWPLALPPSRSRRRGRN